MPQFQMDTAGVVARKDATGLQAGEGVTLWRDLDAFTQGYVEAMFFTEEREHVEGEDVEESGSIPHNSCFGMIDDSCFDRDYISRSARSCDRITRSESHANESFQPI